MTISERRPKFEARFFRRKGGSGIKSMDFVTSNPAILTQGEMSMWLMTFRRKRTFQGWLIYQYASNV